VISTPRDRVVPVVQPSNLPPPRRFPFLRLALLALAVLTLALLLLAGDPRETIERGLEAIRTAGPVAYFSVMAVVPLPLAWFTIPAGEAFAAQMTLPGVIAAALVAVAVQVAWCYWAARRGLRPVLHAWLARRGYVVPAVSRENALAVALLVRLTPGPPIIIGSFVLGVAGVPFGIYLFVSLLVAIPWVIGGVVLGKGVLGGNFALGGIGLGVLGAGAAAAHLARKRWLRRAPKAGQVHASGAGPRAQ
jgi:uncharacterized membrane protein YdjX (TVP38/TMEM64 family)